MSGKHDGIVAKVAAKVAPITMWTRKRKQSTLATGDGDSRRNDSTKLREDVNDETSVTVGMRRSKRSRRSKPNQVEDAATNPNFSSTTNEVEAEANNESETIFAVGSALPRGEVDGLSTATEPSMVSTTERKQRHPSLGPIVTPEKMMQGTLPPQSDESRRLLRKQFRKLNELITTTSVGIEMERPNSTMFQQVRHKNNLLYNHVQFTREAVLDCQNFTEIAIRLGKQYKSADSEYRFDVSKFCTKLKVKFLVKGRNLFGIKRRPAQEMTRKFDWIALGEAVGSCYRTVPGGVQLTAINLNLRTIHHRK